MLARKSILQFIVQIVSSAINLIALSMIGHHMGPTPLGILSYAASYVNIFSFIGDMGIGTAHIKKVSEGKPIDKCIRVYLTIRIILTSVMIAAITLMMLYKIYWGDGFESETHIYVIILAMINMIICVYPEVISSTVSAQVKTALQNIPGFIGTVVYGISTVIAVYFFKEYGALALAAVTLLRVLSRNISILYFCKNTALKIGKFDFPLLKEYFLFSIPIILSSLTISIALNIDKIMIQEFHNSSEVGLYYGTQRIQQMLLLISGTLFGILIPTFSRLSSEKNIPAIKQVMYKSEKFLCFLVIPLTLCISIFPKWTINTILGPQFLKSENILYCFLMIAFFTTIVRPSNSCLVGIGKIKIHSIMNIADIALMVCLNAFFIPKHIFGYKALNLGGFGAALSTLLLSIFSVMISKFLVYKYTGIKPYYKTLPRLLIAFIIFGAVKYTSFYNSMHTLSVIVSSLTVTGSYFVILFTVRLIKIEDISYVWNQLHFGKMISYIKKEIRGN